MQPASPASPEGQWPDLGGGAPGAGGAAVGAGTDRSRRGGMPPASSASLGAQWPDLVAAVSAAIDLDATARTSGALVRRREIRSAEASLRLALAYGPGGLSLRMAAAWAGVSGLADLSDTAALNRLRNAAASPRETAAER